MWMLRRPSFMPAPWSCPCSAAQPPLAAHVRKEQHVADRCGVGQQHDQAVDAQPLPAGGREAVFQRPDVVVVEVHRLVVASVAGLDLVAESGVAPTDRYSPRSSHIPVSDVRFDSRVISTSPPGRPPRSAPAPRRQRRQPQGSEGCGIRGEGPEGSVGHPQGEDLSGRRAPETRRRQGPGPPCPHGVGGRARNTASGVSRGTKTPSPATPRKRASARTPADASPTDIRPTGKWVARLRRRCGLTVAQFAARLGVSVVTVYRWEATPGRLNLHSRPLNALTALYRRSEAGGLIRKSSRGDRERRAESLDPFDCGTHPRCADEPPVTGDEHRGQGLRRRDVDGVIRGRNGAWQVP